MGADPIERQHYHSSVERLRELDSMLDTLEGLNLDGARFLPLSVGSALIDLGINNPYRFSITHLIDIVLDLEKPLLRIKSNVVARSRGAGGRRRYRSAM